MDEKGQRDLFRGKESLEAREARHARDDPGREATPTRSDEPSDKVLVQVCIECGNKHTFADREPPETLSCERCGNEVFRTFYDTPGSDAVDAEFDEATDRDLDPDDPAGDATESDVRDLNNI